MPTTNSEARKRISEAITAFEKAEDTASGSQQLVLLDIIENLRNERREIDALDLAKRNEVYAALTGDIRDAKRQLDELTEEIKELIRRAEQAAEVAGALARLLEFVAEAVA